LHRRLRALAGDGMSAEEQRGIFRNTPASKLLQDLGYDDFAHLIGGVWHRTVGELIPARARACTRGPSDDF
jgi:hypothetical protein